MKLAKGYEKAGVDAFAQDFEIWGNKRPCINPMMVKGDGPFDKLRIWYKQFYNPRARAGEFQARVNGHYVNPRNVRRALGCSCMNVVNAATAQCSHFAKSQLDKLY